MRPWSALPIRLYLVPCIFHRTGETRLGCLEVRQTTKRFTCAVTVICTRGMCVVGLFQCEVVEFIVHVEREIGIQ